jgi:hypothetical protein
MVKIIGYITPLDHCSVYTRLERCNESPFYRAYTIKNDACEGGAFPLYRWNPLGFDRSILYALHTGM